MRPCAGLASTGVRGERQDIQWFSLVDLTALARAYSARATRISKDAEESTS
jgi:hypothetical protein